VRNTFNILLCFILLTAFSRAQTDELNHRKYWYYKSRLNNDFVKVGLKAGESLPFNQRGQWIQDFNVENCELKSGDATSTLGYYIALLATEYYLLSKNDQSTEKVRHELFCALNAVNRLDYTAEALWEAGRENLNGFFIRDDIPGSFVSDPDYYAHFNYYDAGMENNRSSRGFCSQINCGANLVQSDWLVHASRNEADISMSQDQVYNLLFGLSFVNKFVPLHETDRDNVFGYGSGETRLLQEARNITSRIIGYVRNSVDFNGNSCLDDISTGWSIRNPLTCNSVPSGDDAHAYAYPIAEIGCIIKYPHYANIENQSTIPFVCDVLPENGFHNAYSSTIGFPLWNLTAKTSLHLPSNSHYAAGTRGFNASLTALCNCVYGKGEAQVIQQVVKVLQNMPVLNWLGVAVSWAYMWTVGTVASVIPAYYINESESTVAQVSYINGKGTSTQPMEDPGCPFDHAPLVLKILHGAGYRPNPRYSFDYLLNVAPCDNIYNLNHFNYGHYEWSSDNRLDRPDRRGWSGQNNNSENPLDPDNWRPPSGEYNAIDFMLYHNLWKIHKLQQGINPRVRDLSEVIVESIANFKAGNISAFEKIMIMNQKIIASDSVTFFRAGKEIYFGPGCEISSSGNLHAFIRKFNCATEAIDSWYVQSDTSINTNKKLSPFDQDLLVMPTVAIDKIKVFYKIEENEKGFLEITDLSGKTLYSSGKIGLADNGFEISIAEFSSGMYILRFNTTMGRLLTCKIIKL
jgi:hypothetical protein